MWNMQAAQFWFWAMGGFAFAMASIATVTTWLKDRQERRAREWERAHQAYERFLDIAIANPEFTAGYWSGVSRTPEEKNKYRWFMARFLWAAEQALQSVPERRKEWEDVARVMLREHVDFLAAPEAQEEVQCYYGPLAELIAEAIHAAHRPRDLTGAIL